MSSKTQSRKIVFWGTLFVLVVAGVSLRHHLLSKEIKEDFGLPTVEFRAESGDLMTFLDSKMREYGSTQKFNGDLREFYTDWEYAEDENGFQIFIDQSRQKQFIQAMAHHLGKPIFSDGHPYLLYRAKEVGVTITGYTGEGSFHLVVLREGVIPDEKLPIEFK